LTCAGSDQSGLLLNQLRVEWGVLKSEVKIVKGLFEQGKAKEVMINWGVA
jgi:hypothetical protein